MDGLLDVGIEVHRIDDLNVAAGGQQAQPRANALERRADCPAELFARLTHGAFLVGLSSVYWREAWKYGERGFRYCQHDAGHAIGALRIAAIMPFWSLRLPLTARTAESISMMPS